MLPLPSTRTTPMSSDTCASVSPTSSDTRRPVAYSVSSIARSRSPSVPRRVRHGEHRLDLRLGEILRQPPRQFRRAHAQRRVDGDAFPAVPAARRSGAATTAGARSTSPSPCGGTARRGTPRRRRAARRAASSRAPRARPRIARDRAGSSRATPPPGRPAATSGRRRRRSGRRRNRCGAPAGGAVVPGGIGRVMRRSGSLRA